ncbi:hypothetical protein SAMN05216215_10183 [Saccharopolyspora shandongensis]|uniref:CYTH domain-containing protein n=1 Tax=Saccharopolyspora shandongensis TaxID=418495 RepID=A0A1H3G198_9PSEU|nr:hypothetical protein [Saccharopolyspora shandongensis]SDX97031.1 hypothetical protein SAMN05216215_10183 [Saccharopolyspora shandongensis]
MEVERKRELPSHINPQALINRLVQIGFRDDGHLVEIDTYYSRPDVDFMETVECLAGSRTRRVRRDHLQAGVECRHAQHGRHHHQAGNQRLDRR